MWNLFSKELSGLSNLLQFAKVTQVNCTYTNGELIYGNICFNFGLHRLGFWKKYNLSQFVLISSHRPKCSACVFVFQLAIFIRLGMTEIFKAHYYCI